MKGHCLFFILLLSCFRICAQNKTYYISPSGNEANNGLATTTPWPSLAHVNNLNLEPGDRILLEGGQIFADSVLLDSDDLGTTENPIIIGSYGNGKATLHAINSRAISALNAGGIRIANLILKGDGSDNNGIHFRLNQTNADIDYVAIDSVEVFGFGGRGFLMGAYDTDKGFNHVKVEHSSFHDNGIAGLETFGAYPLFSNTDLRIAYCKFYNNKGQTSSTAITGNGAVVSGVDGGVIEYCEAYNNGENNRSPGGGPVGIWVYDAKNVIIQFCESHNNKAGLLKDGGGFDIDGGAQYCIIQYCYSHDNEGAGFALVEYGSPNTFIGNIIRYNISQNDGRKNNFSGIILYAVDAQHPIKNSEVYNNTIYLNASNLTDGKPSALSILSKNFEGVAVRNNIFYVTAGVDLVYSLFSLTPPEISLQNNNYFSLNGNYDFWWNGTHYTSFESWKAAASGQELAGIVQNPILEGAGTGTVVNPADGGSFNSLFGYTLNPFSPLVDKAVKYGDMGNQDFFGKPLPLNADYDIGAAEALTISVLPLTIVHFEAKNNTTEAVLNWKVTNEEYLQKYEIQKSENGIKFKTIGSVTANGDINYSFTDKDLRTANQYYRLRYIYPNGRSGVSKTIKISASNSKAVQSFYREGYGAELKLYSDNHEKASLFIYSATGALMQTSTLNLQPGYNSIIIEDAVRWNRGVYFIEIRGTNNIVSKFIK